jgi:DNA-binding NarL/FixJ family response regulator
VSRLPDSSEARPAKLASKGAAPNLGNTHAAELLRRIAAADRGALGELYDLLAPAVHAFTLRVLAARRRRLGARSVSGDLAARARLHPDSIPDAKWLRGSLQALPAGQRAVLELSYFAGYSSAEIAQELAIPIGTVKSRMARAIAQLRQRMRDPCGAGA